jgi:large subunit ribosomal protein L11
MAKKVENKIKLQIPAGKANPAPPIGPVLGQAGINIGDFVNRFNSETASLGDDVIPVEISVYTDHSFDFILKTPPASNLLMKVAGVKKGSGKNLVSKAGSVTKAQVKQIAKQKMEDLNANDIEAAMKIIAGTARSMGMEVKG